MTCLLNNIDKKGSICRNEEVSLILQETIMKWVRVETFSSDVSSEVILVTRI